MELSTSTENTNQEEKKEKFDIEKQNELIEMSREKLYIQNKNEYEINEENVMNYIKSILNVLMNLKLILINL